MAAAYQRWAEIENPEFYVKASVRNASRRYLRQSGIRSEPWSELVEFTTPVVSGDDRVITGVDLRGALGCLNPTLVEVVVLRFYADLSEAEIAAAVGCRPGTVKSRLHRALRLLERRVSP